MKAQLCTYGSVISDSIPGLEAGSDDGGVFPVGVVEGSGDDVGVAGSGDCVGSFSHPELNTSNNKINKLTKDKMDNFFISKTSLLSKYLTLDYQLMFLGIGNNFFLLLPSSIYTGSRSCNSSVSGRSRRIYDFSKKNVVSCGTLAS